MNLFLFSYEIIGTNVTQISFSVSSLMTFISAEKKDSKDTIFSRPIWLEVKGKGHIHEV
jgi:hypothetical protein